MAIEERALMPMHQLSVIGDFNPSEVQASIKKINQFQAVVQRTLRQNHDYGIIPGTPKPTLLKPGAEKILMLLGLRSEFEVVDSTRDFENGFFQYQVKCRLYKYDSGVTEGLGACNTRERKYATQDAYSIDNTVLKMAKKRALIDATLLVASLSDIFTQDIEDMDLSGESAQASRARSQQATDQSGTITTKQAKRLFALAKGKNEIVRQVLSEYGFDSSAEVTKVVYEEICGKVQGLVALDDMASGDDDIDLPFDPEGR